jgi:hypothetical protein
MYEHVQTQPDKDDLDAELIANVDAACHPLARFVTRSIANGLFGAFRRLDGKFGLLQMFHGLWDG